jgi:hypothetical protein
MSSLEYIRLSTYNSQETSTLLLQAAVQGLKKYKYFVEQAVELPKCLKRRMIKHYTPDWKRQRPSWMGSEGQENIF